MSRLRAAAVIAVGLGILGGLGLTGHPAKAEVNTQDLAEMCQGKTGNPDVGIAMCNMYIAGVTDMHFYAQYETGQRFFCFKQDVVTGNDIRKLFLDWLRKNPDMIHQSARYSLIQAMISAYPCRD
jgi:Rap1a immunity proteins